MRIVPTFSGLLIALQLVAAVPLGQLDPVGFAKIRRAVVDGEDSASLGQLQGGLERRTAAEFSTKVADLVEMFKGKGPEAEAEFTKQLKQLYEGSQPEKERIAASTHYYQPGPSYKVDNGLANHAKLQEHEDVLRSHQRVLESHDGAIKDYGEGFVWNSEKLQELRESQEKLGEAQKGTSRALKWGVGGALGVATLASVSSVMDAAASHSQIEDLHGQLAAQQADIDRLKAGAGAGGRTSVGGPGASGAGRAGASGSSGAAGAAGAGGASTDTSGGFV